jgi:hypothetical protein
LIQRFGSALNLNVHFHTIFLDGVYVDEAGADGKQGFVEVVHHEAKDIVTLTNTISLRIARYLEQVDWEQISIILPIMVALGLIFSCTRIVVLGGTLMARNNKTQY